MSSVLYFRIWDSSWENLSLGSSTRSCSNKPSHLQRPAKKDITYEASLDILFCRQWITKVPIRLCRSAGIPLLFACNTVRFSRALTHFKFASAKVLVTPKFMGGSRGGRGSGPPVENHKNIVFLSNADPDPLEFTKLPSQHSMCWAIIGTPVIKVGP